MLFTLRGPGCLAIFIPRGARLRLLSGSRRPAIAARQPAHASRSRSAREDAAAKRVQIVRACVNAIIGKEVDARRARLADFGDLVCDIMRVEPPRADSCVHQLISG